MAQQLNKKENQWTELRSASRGDISEFFHDFFLKDDNTSYYSTRGLFHVRALSISQYFSKQLTAAAYH